MTTCLLVSAPFGGIQVHFELLERELLASGRFDRVETLWLGHRPESTLERVPVLGSSWLVNSARATTERLAALRRAGTAADVIVANHVNPVLLANPRWESPPLVLHLDTTPKITASMAEHYLGRRPRHPLLERAKLGIYRRALERPGACIVVSDLVRRSLVEDYHVDGKVISVVPYPVDLGFWSPRPDDPRRDGASVLFVGADLERKGGDIVIRTARHPMFAECRFDVVTRSTIDDLPPNVRVHVDVAPHSERLRRLFAEASIFVLPTRADLSPIVLAEAMAMGLPVVSTDVGAIADLVSDGESGFLVPPNDDESFRARLAELSTSEVLRSEMGAAARRLAALEHDSGRAIERYVDVLIRCAATGPSTR